MIHLVGSTMYMQVYSGAEVERGVCYLTWTMTGLLRPRFFLLFISTFCSPVPSFLNFYVPVSGFSQFSQALEHLDRLHSLHGTCMLFAAVTRSVFPPRGAFPYMWAAPTVRNFDSMKCLGLKRPQYICRIPLASRRLQ